MKNQWETHQNNLAAENWPVDAFCIIFNDFHEKKVFRVLLRNLLKKSLLLHYFDQKFEHQSKIVRKNWKSVSHENHLKHSKKLLVIFFELLNVYSDDYSGVSNRKSALVGERRLSNEGVWTWPQISKFPLWVDVDVQNASLRERTGHFPRICTQLHYSGLLQTGSISFCTHSYSACHDLWTWSNNRNLYISCLELLKCISA